MQRYQHRSNLVRTIVAATLPVLLLGASANCHAQDGRVLFDFRETPQPRIGWANVNDGVMGGVSEGRHGMTGSGELRFFGRLSLANNGGFASVRSRSLPFRLTPNDALLLRVRGDDRTYNLDLRVPSTRMAYTYRVALPTEAGKWQEFRVPLSMFVATSFGRVQTNSRPVDAQRVQSVGFTLSDKKAGPFQLDVAWIKAVNAAAL